MDGAFNYVTVVFLLGAAQGVFLSVLLFNKKTNTTPNRFLALLMISYSAFIAESSIAGTVVSRHCPHLLGLAAGVILLIGPLHYLYARSLVTPGFHFSKSNILHLIPFAAFYLYFLFPYYLKSGEYKTEYIQSIAVNGPPVSLVLFNWVAVLQGIAYMTVTLMFLKRHTERIKDTFSSIDRITLNWLRNITVMTLVVWALGLLIKLAELFGRGFSIETIIPVIIAVLVYIMGYLGLRQPEIFSGAVNVMNMKEMKKYERSGLTREKAQAILDKLIRLMETEKPYADSNLKLGELANMLSVTPNYLSQALNDSLQQNFFDFVNRYRIEESKKLILDASQQQFTLLSIAYDVGFNSKSAFYTAFKKHTGMTPTQFKTSFQEQS